MTLGFLARAIVQVLAAHAVVSTVASLIVLAAWRRVASDSVSSASTTSRRLFRLRMAPAVAAAVLAWGGIPIAFALWEPTGKIERVGPVALTLAVAGAALMASSLWRLTMALRETQRIHRSLVDATRGSLPARRFRHSSSTRASPSSRWWVCSCLDCSWRAQWWRRAMPESCERSSHTSRRTPAPATT